ncbi:MAG: hypothetical protein KDD51_15010 [Bdellovibrionales bacterium]|nr:hypothetical protein [Bdellovibrionales bacterium]
MEVARITEYLMSVLFLPILNNFVYFAWGAHDPFWVAMGKRVFLLLPVLAIILGYWASVISLLTVPIRADRQAFVNAILITWWDMGRAIFSFWGGVFKCVFTVGLALFGVLRLGIVGIWLTLQDVLLIPFRVAGNLFSSAVSPGVPWIAVGLTFFWCTLEAVIFTYVTSPLVMDTLSNMTGEQMSEAFIRVPLFMFMSFVVLGSYAVLSSWTSALKTRDVPSIVKIGVIESVALFVEVVFLYREFVDALVPWFAQHSGGNFSLGIFGTLAIAGITWFGIRGMSWFLFASAGTPTILAIIQGSGLRAIRTEHIPALQGSFQLLGSLITELKKEMEWIREKGEEVLASFILPPLQIVAGAINFCTLLITKQHTFRLPFRTLNDLKTARTLLQQPERQTTSANNTTSETVRRRAA